MKNTSFKNKLFTNHIHARTSENTPQYLLILAQVFYQVSISQKLRIFFFNNVPSCNIYDFTMFISSKITYNVPTIQHTIYMYIFYSWCSFPVNFLLCTNIPNFNVYNFPVIQRCTTNSSSLEEGYGQVTPQGSDKRCNGPNKSQWPMLIHGPHQSQPSHSTNHSSC